MKMRMVLASGLAAAAMLAGGSIMAQQGTDTAALGSAAFEQYCRSCHEPAKMARILAQRPPEAVRAETLDFLARHGRSDDATDAAIVDYLLALPTRSAP